MSDFKNKKTTILYERLSAEDDRDGDSNSIISQRNLLQDYAERHGFTPYQHISDDGFSGTDWQRPGWQELMSKIEIGEVKCVLVKDSSRIGRDFLRVGLFREMCREKDVRLIAVTDNFDSANGEDEFSPFRDLMAEWYARDISKKISSSLQAKGRKGIPISSRPPYGYIRDPQDKTRWLVDETAAAIVRRIYNLTVEGKPPFEICRILHDEKVERPSYYLTKNGYVNYAGALEAENPYAWVEDNVKKILRREEYLGHVVNFRIKKPSFKSKRQINLPKEEWAIFENVHESIVAKETWELVQELRKTKRRHDKFGEVNPLTGLIRCSDCDSKMYHHRSKKGGHDYYECSNYSLSRQRFASEHCSPHSVPTKAIRELLLDIIRKTAGFVKEHEKDFIKLVQENYSIKKGQTTKTHSNKIAKNERRIVELDKLFTNLYEDKVSGVISQERFAQMSSGFEKEQSALREENNSLQAEIDIFNEDNERADKFISLVRRYTRFEELTASVINEFIEKIVIHEAVWSEANETNRRLGTRSQQIDVYLKYIGNFNIPDTRTPEEIEAERIAEEKLEARRKRQREYARRKAAEKHTAESKNMEETSSKTQAKKSKKSKTKTA